jgi:AcrR family transcriptional regulator
VTQESRPAVPETAVQRARYERVIAAATEVLSAGGREAVQMKDLAQRAGVSLATLYRYFPSKDYVLLAVTLSRYQAAWRQVSAEAPRGDTVRARVAAHLLREFGAQQRNQRLTAALSAALTGGGRSYSSIIEAAEHTHARIVAHVAAGGGPLSEQQERLLTVVLDIARAATRRWLAGACSVAEAEAQIVTGCQLLELPAAVVDEELRRAAPDGAVAPPSGSPWPGRKTKRASGAGGRPR